MKLVMTEDIETQERVLCLRISAEDLQGMDMPKKDRTLLRFCEEEGSISSRLLVAAVLARSIEKSHRPVGLKIT